MRILVLLGDAVAQRFIAAAAPRAAELGAVLVPARPDDLDRSPADADGFVVVTPDDEWRAAAGRLARDGAWKPVGFVSGRRVALYLIPPGGAGALAGTVAVREAEGGPDGQAAAAMLDELVRLGRALRPMREAARSAPGPLPGSYVRHLTADDAAEVTVLQRCAWTEEAIVNESLGIPALHESPDEVRTWLHEWHTTGLWRDGRLLGMVRTLRDGPQWHIGRLAVVPDLRGRGLGRWLLRAAEAAAEPGCTRFALVTGEKSVRNQEFYRREGYRPVDGPAGEPILRMAKDIRFGG